MIGSLEPSLEIVVLVALAAVRTLLFFLPIL
jgi:hypothetical protein